MAGIYFRFSILYFTSMNRDLKRPTERFCDAKKGRKHEVNGRKGEKGDWTERLEEGGGK